MTLSSGPASADLLRRLRARPVSSWRHGERERAMRAALQRLADLAADAAGEPRRTVPDVGLAALVDQLTVLWRDAADAGVAEAELAGVIDGLARALAVR